MSQEAASVVSTPAPQAVTLPGSSPKVDEFAHDFLSKHQQLVEIVLRENCANVIEAITRQTRDLILQPNAAGSFSLPEPKLVFEPKFNSQPIPSVLGSSTRLPSYAFGDSSVSVMSYGDMSICLAGHAETPPNSQHSSADKLRGVSILTEDHHSKGDKPADIATRSTTCNNVIQTMSMHPMHGSLLEDFPPNHRKSRNMSLFRSSVVDKRQSAESLRKSVITVSQDQNGGLKVRNGVFADPEAMKEKLRLAITQTPYDVANCYHESGLCQSIAKSSVFEFLTLGVIGLNAFWMSVDVDHNDASVITDASPVFIVADNAFCLYFLVELSIRFGAFRTKQDALKDSWFVFDSCMLAMMVLETWLLPLLLAVATRDSGSGGGLELGDSTMLKMFRIARLMRIMRVLKILHALPELMVVIKGLFAATRAVACTVALMLLIIYVFAITFRQVTDGTDLGKEVFGTVPDTMRYLLVLGTTPDLYDYVNTIWNESAFFAMIFMIFILLVTITIMNMLVGVLVGVVNTVASVEQEQLMLNFVKDNLLALLRCLHEEDADQDQRISRDEFRCLIQNPNAIRCFTAMNVDVVALVDLVDFIFQDGQYLDFPKFMDLILQLRGTKGATVKDIVDLRRFITMEFNSLLQALDIVPEDSDPYQEIGKRMGAEKSDRSIDPSKFRELREQCRSIRETREIQSRVETGILQPLVESTEKERCSSEEASPGGGTKKKKLRRKNLSSTMTRSSISNIEDLI